MPKQLKATALNKIHHQHKTLIADHPILKSAFKELMRESHRSKLLFTESDEHIFNRLMAELSESIQDNQRMDGESPAYSKDNSKAGIMEEYLRLKHALNDYRSTYK